jgi:hypothetical protein
MLDVKADLIKSKNVPLKRKNKQVKITGRKKPAKILDNLISFFKELKFKKKQKATNADKSKTATILKRNAIPKSKPVIKKFFRFIKKYAAAIMGKSIKFSALAMFPSSIGSPNNTANMAVVIMGTFLFLAWSKSFFDKKKKKIIASIPKIRETSLNVNWSD